MENNHGTTQKKRALLWTGLAILVLIVIVIFAVRNQADPSIVGPNDSEVNTGTVPAEDTSDGSVNASTSGNGTVAPVTSAVSMSYQTALETYKDKRIQFNQNCEAFPSETTYKNGTTLMIDNRSPRTLRLKFLTSISVSPYSFKIVKLSTPESTLPRAVFVDCGDSENVATILLQK